MQHVAWLAMGLMVASCRFELPKVSEGDAPGDGPPPQYSSCMDLALTCGAGGTRSCCELATPIPEGTFLRGYDAATDAYDDMSYPATVSAFALDRYEVTVGRFRKFVEAGQGTQESPPAEGAGGHPRLPSSGWEGAWNTNLAADTATLTARVKCDSLYQTWTDAPGPNENKPMSCVNWYEAMAFCIWDGGYLPTEAEWGYAASGGSEQRTYPWSLDPSSTSIDCTYANYYVNNPPGTSCVNGTNPVGSESPNGDGRWGHSDLAGNVWEWTLDWYAPSYPLPCSDCANLEPTLQYRMIRGGGLGDDATNLRAAYRDWLSPTERLYNNSLGVRCARSPQSER